MLVIPQKMRKILDLQEGDLLLAELHNGGILLRPAVTLPIEIYALERKVELLLANAIDFDDLQTIKAEVLSWGLDPEAYWQILRRCAPRISRFCARRFWQRRRIW